MINIWKLSVNSKIHHLYSYTHATVITFLRIRDMTPILVNTCCRLRPSRGTPSANVSALSAPGSQRWRMNRETYALKFFSDFPRKSRTNLEKKKLITTDTSLKSPLHRYNIILINHPMSVHNSWIRIIHYNFSTVTVSIKPTQMCAQATTRNHSFL
jgi:hypothetical protein